MLDGAVRQKSSDELIHRLTHNCASARKPRPLRRGRHMAPAAVAFAVTPRFSSLRAVRAVAGDAEDEGGKEPADQGGTASTVAEAPVASEVAETKVNLKKALYGTERGLRASGETQAEVVEIITLNPMPAPTLLNGKWILAYTAFIPLYP